jgi:hypothetical protein
MQRAILAAVVCAALVGCTAESDARRALEGAGYTDIVLTGYGWFECGRDDTFATAFTATGPTGKRVSGTVCAGLLLKGQTIRTN